MKARTAARLAWFIGALVLAMFLAGVAFAVSRPAQLPEGIEPFELLGLLEDAPFLVFVGLGTLIAARRPENPIGWMFTAIGFLILFSFFATEYALYALHTDPGSLPGGAFMAWAGTWPWLIGLGLVVLVILLFPNGRLASRRWRPLAWLVVADTAVLALAPALLLWPTRGLQLIDLGRTTVSPVAERIVVVAFPVLLVMMLPALASMLLRFRRARGDERQQLKWVAYGAGVLVGSVVFSELGEGVMGISPGSAPSLLVDAVGILAIPVATGVAVLKYRLYDIDLIINRTLVYGSLTAILGLGYVTVVAGISSFAGESSLTIAAATLAMAALFLPLRQRVQSFIDRRFYRRKYDAAKTLEAFSARLRGEIELASLSGELVAVVQRTMQPRQAWLWLRSPKR